VLTPATSVSLKPFLLALILAATGTTLAASTNSAWFLRVWQVAEGLPDNSVVGTEQVQDGFVWVATQGGLVRFDGMQFREFMPATEAGEPTSLMQALFLDRSGRLWVAKDRGVLLCIDRGSVRAFTSADGLRNQEVRLVTEDAQGAIWVSYIGGDVVRLRDSKFHPVSQADGLPPGGTCQMVKDRDGQLWFAKGGQIGVLRGDRLVTLTNLVAQRIGAAKSGGIWTCVGLRLSRYHEDKGAEFIGTLPSALPNVTPTVLFEDHAGALWIGTRNAGLFRLGPSGFESVPTSHNEICSVMEDREGNIWVGTRGGLNRLRPSVLEVTDIGSGVPFEAVRSVCQDSDDALWSVGQSGIVCRKLQSTWSPVSTDDGWSVTFASCVAANPGGGVWIGTQYKGLHRWRAGQVVSQFTTTNGLAGNYVRALLATAPEELWVGTEASEDQRQSLQQWRAGQWRTYQLPQEGGSLVAVAADTANQAWVATAGGLLFRVDGERLVNETPRTLGVPQAIRCLLATPDGSLWIGYAGRGVGRLKAGHFSLYRRSHGLQNDYVSQMVADRHGRLWFAGNEGVSNVKLAELDSFAVGGLPSVHSVLYGRNEGLRGTQASYGSCPGAFASADGCLWIPMQTGVARIDPGFQENPVPPKVVVERVLVEGRTVAAYQLGQSPADNEMADVLDLGKEGARLHLKPGYQQVQFEFAALSFSAPQNVDCKYRLHGLDKDWVSAGGRRVAYYPHLPPGDYRFQVIACNDAGIWDENGATLAFTAEPFLWQTLWFRVAATASVLALVVGVVLEASRREHRRRVRRLELERGTERERARIAQDLHDDLGAGLTQISLNTALAQNPAMPPDLARGLLHEVDQRARELVTALDEIVWAVNPKNDTVRALSRYLCQFAQRYLAPGGMACRLEVSDSLPDTALGAEQRHHLFLAFKEALHNALRHSGATELKLTIAADAKTLSVKLEDNGQGFEPGQSAEGADGLGNMQARMERLGGSCVVMSVPGKGTTVRLLLPLEGERT